MNISAEDTGGLSSSMVKNTGCSQQGQVGGLWLSSKLISTAILQVVHT
ncbi:hypothetical protein R3X26_00180 [Vibrio sp. TH_r3]|nr:hypothetical protein [Vibrio sp. TH_r3]MDV7102817.1 hypothetical protein [Vibrio sp. TH_r3]